MEKSTPTVEGGGGGGAKKEKRAEEEEVDRGRKEEEENQAFWVFHLPANLGPMMMNIKEVEEEKR